MKAARTPSSGKAAPPAQLLGIERSMLVLLKVTDDALVAAAVLPVLEMVEEELSLWSVSRITLGSRNCDQPSKSELKLARRAATWPKETLAAVGPFIRAALGGASAVTHDAAARSLSALVSGASVYCENAHSAAKGGHADLGAATGVFQLLADLSVSSLHREVESALRPTALRRQVHEISTRTTTQVSHPLTSLGS